LLGRTNYAGRTIDVLSLRSELGQAPKEIAENDQIVVVKLDSAENLPKQYGILVDELGEIPEVPMHRIEQLDSIVGGNEMIGDMIVKPVDSTEYREMLVVIDPVKLIYKLLKKG
jgi:chemotaxis signal transduction protein